MAIVAYLFEVYTDSNEFFEDYLLNLSERLGILVQNMLFHMILANIIPNMMKIVSEILS